MNAKLLTFLFATLFLVSLASAGLTLTHVSTNQVGDDITINFNLTSTEDYDSLNWLDSTISASNVVFKTLPSLLLIGAGDTEELTAVVTISEYKFGTSNVIIKVKNETGATASLSTVPVTVPVTIEYILSTPEKLTLDKDTTSFTIKNTGNVDLNGVQAVLLSDNSDLTLTLDSTSLPAGETRNVDVTINSFKDLDMITKDAINVSTSEGLSKTIPIIIENIYSTDNPLRINGLEIISVKGLGNYDEWYLFDEIEIEFEVENRDSNNRINDIEVQWGLYDEREGQWLILKDEKSFNLRSKTEKEFVVSFKLDKSTLDVNLEDIKSGRYIFYVTAEGMLEDDEGETLVGTSDKLNVEIEKERDFLLLTNFQIPEVVPCGELVQITIDLWNLGEDDAEEVYITLTSPELGINEKSEITATLRELRSKQITFTFRVPKELKEGDYNLVFKVYDEDGLFDNGYGYAIFNKVLKVEGLCKTPSTLDISALLTSEAVAGKELSITITLENTDDVEKTYQIYLSNYDSWAELVSISAEELTLEAGEIRDITIILKPNRKISGEREFTLTAVYEGVVDEQRINVPIEPKTTWISGLSIKNINLDGDNTLIWALGIAIIILIILIIIVAVRLSRNHDDE